MAGAWNLLKNLLRFNFLFGKHREAKKRVKSALDSCNKLINLKDIFWLGSDQPILSGVQGLSISDFGFRIVGWLAGVAR